MPLLTQNPYFALDIAAGKRYNISPLLLSAQQWVESGWNPGAVSPTGAFGISQFEPSTASAFGVQPGTSPSAVASQVTGEAAYLDQLYQQEGHNPTAALEAYNAGPGGVADAASNGAAAYANQIEQLASGHTQLTGINFNPLGAAASEANRAIGSAGTHAINSVASGVGHAVESGIVSGVKDLINPVLHPILLGSTGFLLVILGVWVAMGHQGRQDTIDTAASAVGAAAKAP